MFKRTLETKLQQLAKQMPALGILGPRQAGKTTLVQKAFPSHDYVTLEDLDTRRYAKEDPRGFLELHADSPGVILDEIQHAPDLLSYIQTAIDREEQNGAFILTGSENLLLNAQISQTLAGRIALFTLLPLSVEELAELPPQMEALVFKGGYPRIHAHGLDPQDWYPNYLRTYVERDLRQIKNITDLSLFQAFLKQCAGRTGQLLSLSSLSNDCGISVNTVKAWLSVLEASYLIFLLQPYHNHMRKRLTKSPKLYFYDTGLAASLLGIHSAKELASHYLRGGLFESFVISEIVKQHYNRGRLPHVYFLRDQQGHEIDCIVQKGDQLKGIEIKAGHTINSSFFSNFDYYHSYLSEQYLIYAGDHSQKRSGTSVSGWKNIPILLQ